MSEPHDDDVKFLYAHHFLVNGAFKKAVVTIDRVLPAVKFINSKGKVDYRPGLSFVGSDKVLLLNKTNEALLIYTFGDQPGEKWHGRKVTLEIRIVRGADGNKCPAIRVSKPVGDGVTVPTKWNKWIGEVAVWSAPAEQP